MIGFNNSANTILCAPCRKSWKYSYGNNGSWKCPSCGNEGRNMGKHYRVPPLRNKKAWKQIDAAWESWLAYEQASKDYDDHYGIAHPPQGYQTFSRVDDSSLSYRDRELRHKSLPKLLSFNWDLKAGRKALWAKIR